MIKILTIKLSGCITNREFFLCFCFVSFPFFVFLYVVDNLFKCCKPIGFDFLIEDNVCYVWEVITKIKRDYPAKQKYITKKKNAYALSKYNETIVWTEA